MSLDEILMRLKAKTYGKGAMTALAGRIKVSDDTMRRILGADPPGWLETMRRMEAVASEETPGPAVAPETGKQGEA